MKTKEEITNEIHALAKEFSTTRQKPYVTILCPRRSLKETPAQQLQDWKNRMIDVTSVAVSFHAIDGNPVDAARCYLMEKALEDDPKYVLFVDEDTAIPYNGVKDMIDVSEKFPNAIISGIYYVKFGNVMMSVLDEEDRWVLPNVNPDAPLIRNVMSTGLGCALIPMHIIKTMKKRFEDIPLFCIVPENTWGDPDVTFIGEDAWFFNLVRKCGFETIGVPSVQCLHMELATGKYAAHPDVVLSNYVTNMPPTVPLTMEDRLRVSKEYIERICKPQIDDYKSVENLPISYSEDTLNRALRYLELPIKNTQNHYEVSSLCEHLQSLRPTRVLEIGVEEGGSLLLWAEFSVEKAKLIGVDDKISKEIIEDNIQKNVKGEKRLVFFNGDSRTKETIMNVVDELGNDKLDFLFIDGGHEYSTVKADYENYSPLVRKGGIIALHDIDSSINKEGTEGARRLWQELKAKYKNTEEYVNTEAPVHFGIGVIFV